jgi:predicted metal-dependent enzyme (double-stranded beta helix superfamily)
VSTLEVERSDAPVVPERAGRLQALACDAAESIARDAFRYEAAAGTRRYARVRSAADHDVWVIVWGPGSSVAPHDHGGSRGAFAVASGALTDRTTTPTGRTDATVVPPGGVVAIDADTVHGVANTTDISAVSVHVYSPPLASMAFYDEDLRELWREDVE